MKEVKNIQRTEEYIKLLHSINSCKNFRQIDTLRRTVLDYHKHKKQDSPELLAAVTIKEHDLFVE